MENTTRIERQETIKSATTPAASSSPPFVEREPRQHDQSECSCGGGGGGVGANAAKQCTNQNAGRIRALNYYILWDEMCGDRASVRLSFQILAEPSTSFVIVRTAANSLVGARITSLEPVYVPLKSDSEIGQDGSSLDLVFPERKMAQSSPRDDSVQHLPHLSRSMPCINKLSQLESLESVSDIGKHESAVSKDVAEPRQHRRRLSSASHESEEQATNLAFPTHSTEAQLSPDGAATAELTENHLSTLTHDVSNSSIKDGLGLRNQATIQSLLSMESEEFAQPLFDGLTKRRGSQTTVVVSPRRTPSSQTARTTSSAPSPTPILVLKDLDDDESRKDGTQRFEYQSTPCPADKKKGTPQTQMRKAATTHREPWKAPSISDLSPSFRDGNVSPKISKLPVVKRVIANPKLRRQTLDTPIKKRNKKQSGPIENKDARSPSSGSSNASSTRPDSPFVRSRKTKALVASDHGKPHGFHLAGSGAHIEQDYNSTFEGTGLAKILVERPAIGRVSSSDGSNDSISKSMDIAPRPTWSDSNGLLCIDFPQHVAVEMYDVELEAMVLLSEPDAEFWRDLELSPFFCHTHTADFSRIGVLELNISAQSEQPEDLNIKVRVENLIERSETLEKMGVHGIFDRENIPTIEFRRKEEAHFISDFSVSVTTDIVVLNPHEENCVLAYHVAVIPKVADEGIFAKRAVFDFSFRNLKFHEDTVRLYSDTEEIVYKERVFNDDGSAHDEVCIQVIRDVSTLYDQFNFHLEIPWSAVSAQPFSTVRVKPATTRGEVLSEIVFLSVPPRPLLLRYMPREWDDFKCWKTQVYTNDGTTMLRLDKMPMPTNFPDEMQDSITLRALELDTIPFESLQAVCEGAAQDLPEISVQNICHDLKVSVCDAWDEKLHCTLQFSVPRMGFHMEELLEIRPNGWLVQYAVVDDILCEPSCDTWRLSDRKTLLLYAYSDEENYARGLFRQGHMVKVKICFETPKPRQGVDDGAGKASRDLKLPRLVDRDCLDVGLECKVSRGRIFARYANDGRRPSQCQNDTDTTSTCEPPQQAPTACEIYLHISDKGKRTSSQSRASIMSSNTEAALQENPESGVNLNGSSLSLASNAGGIKSTARSQHSLALADTAAGDYSSDDSYSDSVSDSDSEFDSDLKIDPCRKLRIKNGSEEDAKEEPGTRPSILRHHRSLSPTKLVHWKENLAEVINPEGQVCHPPNEKAGVVDPLQDGLVEEDPLESKRRSNSKLREDDDDLVRSSLSPSSPYYSSSSDEDDLLEYYSAFPASKRAVAVREECRHGMVSLSRVAKRVEKEARRRANQGVDHDCCITASFCNQMFVAVLTLIVVFVCYIWLIVFFSLDKNYYEGVITPGPSTTIETVADGGQAIASCLASNINSLTEGSAEDTVEKGAASLACSHLITSHFEGGEVKDAAADAVRHYSIVIIPSSTSAVAAVPERQELVADGGMESGESVDGRRNGSAIVVHAVIVGGTGGDGKAGTNASATGKAAGNKKGPRESGDTATTSPSGAATSHALLDWIDTALGWKEPQD